MKNVIAITDAVSGKAFRAALMFAAAAFAMVVIVYGLDSVAPGAHDTFHDLRHAIGMPCH